MTTWYEVAALSAAACAAGVINAVAGGGTLITFPTLLAFGTPSVVANATSTLALMVGTVGSVYGYRSHVASIRTWLWRFGPVSVAGGALGSWLLTHTSERLFSRLVPFLILFATLLFLFQGAFRRWAGLDKAAAAGPEGHHLVAAGLFQFGVAVYGGYFGAGIGILMLATLGLLGLTHIHEMNALKTVLSTLINLIATILFIGAGLIDWPKAGVMTAAAMVGYYVGSHGSQRIPPARVRQVITGIGFCIAALTFWREFVR